MFLHTNTHRIKPNGKKKIHKCELRQATHNRDNVQIATLNTFVIFTEREIRENTFAIWRISEQCLMTVSSALTQTNSNSNKNIQHNNYRWCCFFLSRCRAVFLILNLCSRFFIRNLIKIQRNRNQYTCTCSRTLPSKRSVWNGEEATSIRTKSN